MTWPTKLNGIETAVAMATVTRPASTRMPSTRQKSVAHQR